MPVASLALALYEGLPYGTSGVGARPEAIVGMSSSLSLEESELE